MSNMSIAINWVTNLNVAVICSPEFFTPFNRNDSERLIRELKRKGFTVTRIGKNAANIYKDGVK